MKYQNFFSFQNVKSLPHAVNVPFISSHIKVSRSSFEPNYQHDRFTFHVGFFFQLFFFTWSWIQLFFKGNSSCNKKRLYYDVRSWIVLRRAEFRCSESLVFHSNLQSVLLNKKDDTCPPVDTNLSVSIELSLWRCKRCHEHSMVKFVFTRGYLIPHICVCITEQVWA